MTESINHGIITHQPSNQKKKKTVEAEGKGADEQFDSFTTRPEFTERWLFVELREFAAMNHQRGRTIYQIESGEEGGLKTKKQSR